RWRRRWELSRSQPWPQPLRQGYRQRWWSPDREPARKRAREGDHIGPNASVRWLHFVRRRHSYDQVHWTHWIGLRTCHARDRRQRGSNRRKVQKLVTGKFHFEPPSHHPITSWARASSVGGMVRPSAFAVLRLITRSNFVGCWTGKSAGFSPLRMRLA